MKRDKDKEKGIFEKIYSQGTFDPVEIWVDTETGVNYISFLRGSAANFIVRVDKDGKPVVSGPQKNTLTNHWG